MPYNSISPDQSGAKEEKKLPSFELLGIERSSSSLNTPEPDTLVIRDKITGNVFKVKAICLTDSKTLHTELLNNRSTYTGKMCDLRAYINKCYADKLQAQEYSIATTRLGWYQDNANDLFILSEEQECNGRKYINNRESFKQKCGSEYEYKQLLEEVVYPNNNLSLALVIGFSAVVSSRLKDKCGIGTMIFNFSGTTSSGKTTAEKLLVSLFASPTADGLLFDFHSTENGLYAQLNNIHGVPVVLDDITTNDSINCKQLIYSVADSKPKKRCLTDGTLNALSKAGWSGATVISSESPILDVSEKVEGTAARVLFLNDISWTPDAATAERIQRVVSENYGFMGIEFAEYVSKKIPLDDLYTRYEQARKILPNTLPDTFKIKERLEKQCAIVLLTAQLVNDCFEQNLNRIALVRILLNSENEYLTEHIPEEKRALDIVIQYFMENRRNFYDTALSSNKDNDYSHFYNGKYYGRFYNKDNKTAKLYVLATVLDKILTSKGFNKETILAIRKKWRDTGRTKCEKGSTTTTRKNDKGVSECHILFEFDTANGDDLSWCEYPHPEVEDCLEISKQRNAERQAQPQDEVLTGSELSEASDYKLPPDEMFKKIFCEDDSVGNDG